MSNTLRFMGVNKDTTTAGPGKRLEFFTKGCIRGVLSPCFGCFNKETWTFEGKFRGLTVQEVVDISNRDAWNRQVTFCGGEPILQARMLTEVAKQLKKIDPKFHFVMYTAYKLDTLLKYGLKFTWVDKYGIEMFEQLSDYSDSIDGEVHDENNVLKKAVFTILSSEDVAELMKHVDLIVDGDYQHDKRLTTAQYMHNGWFIGSSNQRVIFGPASVKMDELKFLYADEYNQQRKEANHCKSCGHEIKGTEFCGSICTTIYAKREEEMALLGGV